MTTLFPVLSLVKYRHWPALRFKREDQWQTLRDNYFKVNSFNTDHTYWNCQRNYTIGAALVTKILHIKWALTLVQTWYIGRTIWPNESGKLMHTTPLLSHSCFYVSHSLWYTQYWFKCVLSYQTLMFIVLQCIHFSWLVKWLICCLSTMCVWGDIWGSVLSWRGSRCAVGQ